MVFGLTRPGIEPEFTVLVTDVLSARLLIGKYVESHYQPTESKFESSVNVIL